MNFLKSIIGLTTGVSPWLMVGLFAGGLIAGGFGVGWIKNQKIDGLETQVAALSQAIENPDDGYKVRLAARVKDVADRDAEIKRLNGEIEKITAEARDTQQTTLDLLDMAEARADETEKKMAELRRKANAAPEKPRALSPVSRAGYDWGLCRTRAALAGTDPAACN